MAVFQIASRTVGTAVPTKKPRRLPSQWGAIIRFVAAVTGAGGTFAVIVQIRGFSDSIFLLLPVFVYLAVVQFQRYSFKRPFFWLTLVLSSTPAYLLLTLGLALLYCLVITVIELLLHQNPRVSHIVLITTTIAWTIILEPGRSYLQRLIEKRFHKHATMQAIEAFTSTLREEINLEQLRERFLLVIHETIQPYFVSLWVHKNGPPQTELSEVTVADDDALLAYALKHSATIELDQLQLDSPTLQDLRKQRAELLLPLVSQGQVLGLLILGPRLNGQAYSQEDYLLLSSLATQVAPALRVSQMVQQQHEQVRERERIEQELRTARSIQHAFLPKEIPNLSGWQIAPYYQPAREVGGDFYDFLTFEDGCLGLVIGDVTGKGVPAALVMATVQTMLRTAVQGLHSPGAILARVNDLLVANIPPGMFVTSFFALLDPQSGLLRYANAGHEPPCLRSVEGAHELLARGMPLGLLPGSAYEEQEMTLAPGESLFFSSDGLVEAHNPHKEMFGFPRLTTTIATYPSGPSLVDSLLSELTKFTGEAWEQEDDVTIVVLYRCLNVL